ncbi:MAG: DNA polymerase [Candidatus Bathyarchaeia archaeon]
MKLDNETIDILRNFANINPSIMVKKGNAIKTISLTQSVIAKATLAQKFGTEFAIYDLPGFISAMSMFENPSLDFSNENYVVLTNEQDTHQSIRYFFADPSTIIKPPEKEMPTPDTNIKFQLTTATLADIIKAVSVLNLPELAFIGDGKQISVQAIDSKNPSSNLYKKVIGESSAEFQAIFKTENIKMMKNDYNVSIAAPKGKAVPGVAYFNSPSVDYWIVVEAHSSF